MTWDDLARRDSVSAYFVFRGTFASGAAVRWATSRPRFLSPALDPRMSLPAPIVCGMPETMAAPPERVSTSITLDNSDGALTNYFAGGTDTLTAYEGDSFLNLTGQLYLGLVADDGTCQEEAVTPTLCVVGSPSTNGTQITLPLSSDDRDILGPSPKMIELGDLFDAARTSLTASGDMIDGAGNTSTGWYTSAVWNVLLGAVSVEEAQFAPWVFGRAAFPCIRVSTNGSFGGRTYLVGLTASQPSIAQFPDWDLHWSKHGSAISKGNVLLVRAPFSHERADGSTVAGWLLLLELSELAPERDDEDPPLFAIPPTNAHLGIPSGTKATPSNIIRRLITDLSAGGLGGVHASSFDRAAKDVPTAGAFGGAIRSDAAIAEVVTHICGATGIALWHGADDRIHALAVGAWNASDVTEAASAPHLREGDIFEGTWSERIPSGDERGAAATRVSVDWPSEASDFWGRDNTRARAPGVTELEIREENEARIPGAWVFPPASAHALSEVGGRRRHVYRRISFVTHAWVAALGVGALVRVSHRQGMQAGGYNRRLMRLLRYEILPAEMAARCEFEDCDALENTHAGVLDSIYNWVRYRPSPDAEGVGATFTVSASAGGTLVTCSHAVFSAGMVGCSLWTPGATTASDRARRIASFVSTTQVQVDRAYVGALSVGVSAECDPWDEPWIVMDNHDTKGAAYRPDYIRLSEEATGEFTDGTSGFQME